MRCTDGCKDQRPADDQPKPQPTNAQSSATGPAAFRMPECGSRAKRWTSHHHHFPDRLVNGPAPDAGARVVTTAS